MGRAADHLNLTASAVSHGLGRLRRPIQSEIPCSADAQGCRADGARDGILRPVCRRFGARAKRGLDRRAVRESGQCHAPVARSLLRWPLRRCWHAAAARRTAQERARRGRLRTRQCSRRRGTLARARLQPCAFTELEARAMDIARLSRSRRRCSGGLHRLTHYQEETSSLRCAPGHPFCLIDLEMRHLVVSHAGDALVDEILARQGLSRRTAWPVPNLGCFTLPASPRPT